MIGVIGLILGLAVLMYLSFKNWGMIPATIIASLVVIATNSMDIWKAFSVSYADAMKGFVGTYILLFFLGSFFGNLMGESGTAKSIARKITKTIGKDKAILVIIVAGAILSYGGVSLFVIVFALYPIAMVLFKEGNISKNLFPAVMFFGTATFTMTNLPGTPAITNLIPTTFFGTTAYAAPVIGIVSSIVIFVLGYYYFKWEHKRLLKRGIGFVPGPKDNMSDFTLDDNEDLPHWFTAMLPMLVVVVLIFVLRGKVTAIYSVIIALSVGVVLTYAIFWKRIANPLKVANEGASNSITALLNTAVVVGFGGVVAASGGFQQVIAFALSLKMDPLVSGSVAVNIVAGITGSSSGGLTIFMNTLGAEYLKMATAAGISAQVLHRILVISSSALDSMPHTGAIVTTNEVTGLTNKETYRYTFWSNIVIPFIGLAVAIIMSYMGFQ
jgi:H+/gluconate symporter-like permease